MSTAYGNALRKASQVFAELAEAWETEYGQATANPVAVPEQPAAEAQPAQADPWKAPQGPVPTREPAPVPMPNPNLVAPVAGPVAVPAPSPVAPVQPAQVYPQAPQAVAPVAPQAAPQQPVQSGHTVPIPPGVYTAGANNDQSWTLGVPEAPVCHGGKPAAYVTGVSMKSGKPKQWAQWRCAYGVGQAAGLDFRDKCKYQEWA